MQVCREEPEVADALVRRPEAVLSTLDSLKREDFAIGVIAVALGVGAAQVAAQVRLSDIRDALLKRQQSMTDACVSA